MKLPLLLLFAPLLGLTAFPSVSFAQTDAPSPLPVRAVTLFTSGVSYIERGGEVNGNAVVPLTFRTAQINDILKSLTLIDAHGQVQPVTYGARDPIGRTLQAFAIDVTQPQSRADLLNKLRGASVTVTTAAKEILTGQIVSVESKNQTVKDVTTTVDTLNLLTDSGLQSVPLADVVSIKLLDARLDREFREALTTLAAGSDDQRRAVTLRFAGSGRRTVSVGYVTEAPLWKISYRLLLDKKKSYLQGWSLVENTTDDDWSNVHLSLISGRPVSFIEDLYQPLYLPRPVVAPDVIASPYPQTHDDSIEEDQSRVHITGNPTIIASNPVFNDQNGVSQGLDSREAINAPATVARQNQFTKSQPNNLYQSPGLLFKAPGVTAQANGQSEGELFAYNISTPITLPRQQAAMIPVIAQDIQADKVSLYNADSDPKFPLNAVRLTNNTGLHLKGGPITLFDGGTYAGDATMEDVPPGDTRLISYAVDLSVIGERQNAQISQIRTTLTIHRGVLSITQRIHQETIYNFKSKATEPKTVLVEHPFDPSYTLIEPKKADERTTTLYRFIVPVPAGKTATLKVVQEQPLLSTFALLDGNLDQIVGYSTQSDIPEETRQTLAAIVNKRRHVQELSDAASAKDAQVMQIGTEQERIRKNMGALDHTSALYKRYADELDAQETQIQSLRLEANRLRSDANAAQTAFAAYLDTVMIGE